MIRIATLGWVVMLAVGAACGGDDQPGPPVVVGDCGALAAPGVWENITPPDIVVPSGEDLAAFAFAVDPVNQGTVYFGTAYQRMWKTTDCGSTWAPADTGRNGAAWNHAMNWTFAVDPIEPNVVYTNTGYGDMGSGLWKSINSGVDWDPIWPPPGQPDLDDGHLTYNFANVIALDPDDHRHLLLTFHETCTLDGARTCIAESDDAGATWRLIPGRPEWDGNEGQILYFLDARDHWIWGSQSNGFFRTDDGGRTWTQLVDETGAPFYTSHLQGSGMYRTAAGTYYLAASNGVYRSPDGRAWTLVPMTGPIGGGLVGNGTTLFYSRCYFGDFCEPREDMLLTSPETDGQTWTVLPSPTMTQGGSLGYDPGHRLLYSSNGADGFWRVRTE